MQLKSITIIEQFDQSVRGVHSFSADKEGIEEANARFKAILKENGFEGRDEELEECVEDGYWIQGDYQAFIAWSEKS